MLGKGWSWHWLPRGARPAFHDLAFLQPPRLSFNPPTPRCLRPTVSAECPPPPHHQRTTTTCREWKAFKLRRETHNAAPSPANRHTQRELDRERQERAAQEDPRRELAAARRRQAPKLPPGAAVPAALAAGAAVWVLGHGCAALVRKSWAVGSVACCSALTLTAQQACAHTPLDRLPHARAPFPTARAAGGSTCWSCRSAT